MLEDSPFVRIPREQSVLWRGAIYRIPVLTVLESQPLLLTDPAPLPESTFVLSPWPRRLASIQALSAQLRSWHFEDTLLGRRGRVTDSGCYLSSVGAMGAARRPLLCAFFSA